MAQQQLTTNPHRGRPSAPPYAPARRRQGSAVRCPRASEISLPLPCSQHRESRGILVGRDGTLSMTAALLLMSAEEQKANPFGGLANRDADPAGSKVHRACDHISQSD